MTLRLFIILAIAGALIGLLASGVEKLWQPDQTISGKAQLKQLPEFALTSMDGSIWHADQWEHRILVLNYWATWCPPCRDEMPLFIKLQDEFAVKDVQFVGIAIDDREAIQDFIDSHGVDFTILMGDTEAVALAERMGNRFSALPFTVVVDKGGEIKLRHAGRVREHNLRPLLTELSK